MYPTKKILSRCSDDKRVRVVALLGISGGGVITPWLYHAYLCLPLPLVLIIHILSTHQLLPSRSALLFSVIRYKTPFPCKYILVQVTHRPQAMYLRN